MREAAEQCSASVAYASGQDATKEKKMRCRSVFVLGVVAAVFCCLGGVQAAPTFALTPLLPGGDLSSSAYGVDANGDVVGSCTSASDVTDGLLYTRSGGVEDLGFVRIGPPVSPPAPR